MKRGLTVCPSPPHPPPCLQHMSPPTRHPSFALLWPWCRLFVYHHSIIPPLTVSEETLEGLPSIVDFSVRSCSSSAPTATIFGTPSPPPHLTYFQERRWRGAARCRRCTTCSRCPTTWAAWGTATTPPSFGTGRGAACPRSGTCAMTTTAARCPRPGCAPPTPTCSSTGGDLWREPLTLLCRFLYVSLSGGFEDSSGTSSGRSTCNMEESFDVTWYELIRCLWAVLHVSVKYTSTFQQRQCLEVYVLTRDWIEG